MPSVQIKRSSGVRIFFSGIEHNPYFQMMHNSWGQKLRQVFDSIEDPMWNGEQTTIPLMTQSLRSMPLKKIRTPDERLI